MPNFDPLQTLQTLQSSQGPVHLHALSRLSPALPFTIRILLENVLRRGHDSEEIHQALQALLNYSPEMIGKDIPFFPARILLQDFTGVPALADLAALREAIARAGKDAEHIRPAIPADLVIDHSVQVDVFGSTEALAKNTQKEFERNEERYRFLRWGEQSFPGLRVVPPGAGIVHQVNLEYLAEVITAREENGTRFAFPDTLLGTDSHTTMVNGLGVFGYGVGGIEAEAAVLGESVTMAIPRVVGVEVTGSLHAGVTATDVVLTLTEALRNYGVVDAFVEFFGEGLDGLKLADRATLANMAPEYGATVAYFPIDQETISYLAQTGRGAQASFVEETARVMGLWRQTGYESPSYPEVVEFSLSNIEPCIAGPKRPQDRIALTKVKETLSRAFAPPTSEAPTVSRMSWVGASGLPEHNQSITPTHGSVVIAAITSCTNTSNPSVMLLAGLLAKRAVEEGLRVPSFVKTSLAPGSKTVTAYLEKTGLLYPLQKLGFHIVGYGCTTCIGNSGPLVEGIEELVKQEGLHVASVLSGNRNFEGRVHPAVPLNFLASPPLVVAYALAGHMDLDFDTEPLGVSPDGRPVYLRNLWPSLHDLEGALRQVASPELFTTQRASLFEGNAAWKNLSSERSPLYSWETNSTFIRCPPFIEISSSREQKWQELKNARVLALFGDSVTTDHISPAGAIAETSDAGRYLRKLGVEKKDFNSYGARRGNHEVMMRGTFGNTRIKNLLVEDIGPFTRHFPSGEQATIFDTAMRYQKEQVPLLILAGKDYGMGSSRDWAAKGPALLGIRVVIAESFERIHRSNLCGMGILPLQFEKGEGAVLLGLTGEEFYAIEPQGDLAPQSLVTVTATKIDGSEIRFSTHCRASTEKEIQYIQEGGLLPYVFRKKIAEIA